MRPAHTLTDGADVRPTVGGSIRTGRDTEGTEYERVTVDRQRPTARPGALEV